MLINKKTKYYYIILFILNILVYQVICEDECQCDDSSDDDETTCKNCNSNCLYYEGKCINCPDLKNKPYYKVTRNSDTPWSCQTIEKKKKK